MKPLRLHPSVEFAWALANAEAFAAGSDEIAPTHLLLGILKVADEEFAGSMAASDVPPEVSEDVSRDSADARALLTLSPTGLQRARRSFRKFLREGKQPRDGKRAHRSAATRRLMDEGSKRALARGASRVGLSDVLTLLLENMPEEAKPFLSSQVRKAPEIRNARAAEVAGGDAQGGTALEALGRDLTALARAGRLAPVVGRKNEMTLLARYLHRTSKRNAIVVGDAGVGKTAVVEGLAQRIASGDVPELLTPLRIIQVNVGDLMAGTHYRGDLEERIQELLKAACSDPTMVLFLDEIHLVAQATSGGSALDIANLLKPALAREDFRCIGATTTEEFERYIKPDAAFTRRFQVIRLAEPSLPEAVEVCRAWARRIEEMQGVAFDEEAVVAAVRLSSQLILGRALPDKAIDLLENAAAYVRVSSLSKSGGLPTKEVPHIQEADIVAVLEEQYGISTTATGALDVPRVKAALEREVVGQEDAVQSIAETLATLSTRASTDTRPLGVFLFAGPSGVGKTLAAECLARVLFQNDSSALGRFGMNELKERHDLSRLIGAPPGFVGHEHQGTLFRFATAHPQGLILLDEMEKAHPEIQDYFLQLFERGEATDAGARKRPFGGIFS